MRVFLTFAIFIAIFLLFALINLCTINLVVFHIEMFCSAVNDVLKLSIILVVLYTEMFCSAINDVLKLLFSVMALFKGDTVCTKVWIC